MILNVIFPAALLACILTYIILVGGYRGSVKTLIGHGILIPSLIWLSAATAALYVEPAIMGFMPVFGMIKMLGLGFFFHQLHQQKQPFFFWVLAAIVGLGLLLSMLIDNRAQAAQLFAVSGLAVCLTLLSWNEMIYRESENASVQSKPVFFATSILLVIDFIWLTDALIDGEFSSSMFYVRGVILLLMLPLILKGLLSLQLSPLKMSLSRSAVFHGSILMLCGVYLLVIGGLTSALQLTGFRMENANDVVVLAVLLTPLSVVFVSTRLRRLIRVKISKHLFSEQFDYRQVWLNFASTLHKHTSDNIETTFQSLMDILNHKKGAYIVFSHGRLRMVATKGNVPDNLLERTKPLLPFLMKTGWVADSEEASNNPEQYPEAVTRLIKEFPMRWMIPVVEKTGVVGILFLDEHNSGTEPWVMNWELKDFLLTIAQQWHWHVQAKLNAEKLSQNAQLATFTQTAAFVLHDLKNIDSQMGMLIENSKTFSHDPEFITDAFQSIRHMHARMQKVLTQLSNKQYNSSDSQQKPGSCRLSEFFTQIKKIPEWSFVTTHLFCNDSGIILNATLEKLLNVCAHLLRNASEACMHTGRSTLVHVACEVTAEDVIIRISDNGCGMSKQFIKEKLFKPLETTKGNSGMGLGVFDAKQFAQQIGGELSVFSTPGQGTEFTIVLPKGIGNELPLPA